MEDLVVTLETARKLKAGGFPQDTYSVWSEQADNRNVITRNWPEHKPEYIWAAPTAQELADQLPEWNEKLRSSVTIDKSQGRWSARYGLMAPVPLEARGDTMVEALAALWLELNDTRPGIKTCVCAPGEPCKLHGTEAKQ